MKGARDRLALGFKFQIRVFWARVRHEKNVKIHLVSVVQKVDRTIHWITQLVLIVFIRWIGIYPLDSAILLLNNRGLNSRMETEMGLSTELIT